MEISSKSPGNWQLTTGNYINAIQQFRDSAIRQNVATQQQLRDSATPRLGKRSSTGN